MAFVTPYVFTALELLTAAKMNAIQDNISDLDSRAIILENTTRYISILLNTSAVLTAGDDAARFRIPAALNGWDVYSVAASRKSGTGVPLFQVRNVTGAVDVLSTRISIDSGETDSSTAAAAPVINTANDSVATGDQFAIDVDDAGTNTLYAFVEIGFRPA